MQTVTRSDESNWIVAPLWEDNSFWGPGMSNPNRGLKNSKVSTAPEKLIGFKETNHTTNQKTHIYTNSWLIQYCFSPTQKVLFSELFILRLLHMEMIASPTNLPDGSPLPAETLLGALGARGC